jgi:hypothetical protein
MPQWLAVFFRAVPLQMKCFVRLLQRFLQISL